MLDYYKKKVPRGFEEKIVFTGEVSFEDLPKYYKTAHIFCSPASYGESFGIVLIEAMAAGLPIVAGNNEGYRKVIKDGLNGILVRTEDPRDLAVNLVKLIDNEEMRNRLAKGNYEESKKYSWSNVVNAVECVYMKAIGKGILKTPAYEK
jgi:phosphatidylinositol alpha-mannosyltransferase